MAAPTILPSSPPDPSQHFDSPTKRIHDGPDVQFFQKSLAYRDIMTFILQLNRALVPRKRTSDGDIKAFRLNEIKDSDMAPEVVSIRSLISKLQSLISDAPPDPGPRRFGNVSFRKWYDLVDNQIQTLLSEILPDNLKPAIIEFKSYLLGSFGSPQRLDYGTGHELSFLAFLACLWKLDYFPTTGLDGSEETPDSTSNIERQIALSVFMPYLALVHTLIVAYNLEPAGSHGVWGLDDNSFLPYIFGSAQLSDPLPSPDSSPPTPTPTSGSLPSAPDPSIVTKPNLVSKEASHNLYFAAIDFIHTVKKGPFWEHSPMLFDISGIKDGWGKINKGMIKMYQAEVLAKFPVVQHFVFGSLLRWEQDPEAKDVQQTTHVSNQPLRDPAGANGSGGVGVTTMRPAGAGVGTAAPWATGSGRPPTRVAPPPAGFVNGVTQAPWAKAPAGSSGSGRVPPSTGRNTLSSSRTPQGPSQLRGPKQPPDTTAATQQLNQASRTANLIPEESGE